MKPEINAICTLMIALVAVLVVTASLISKFMPPTDKDAVRAAPLYFFF